MQSEGPKPPKISSVRERRARKRDAPDCTRLDSKISLLASLSTVQQHTEEMLCVSIHLQEQHCRLATRSSPGVLNLEGSAPIQSARLRDASALLARFQSGWWHATCGKWLVLHQITTTLSVIATGAELISDEAGAAEQRTRVRAAACVRRPAAIQMFGGCQLLFELSFLIFRISLGSFLCY